MRTEEQKIKNLTDWKQRLVGIEFENPVVDENGNPATLAAMQNVDPGQSTATIESKTNFLRPARGSRLLADCRALHVGRRTSVWQTTIRDDEKRIVAIVTQTQLHFTPDTPRRDPRG